MATHRECQPPGLPNSAFAAQLIDQTTMSEDDGVYLVRERAYRTSAPVTTARFAQNTINRRF